MFTTIPSEGLTTLEPNAYNHSLWRVDYTRLEGPFTDSTISTNIHVVTHPNIPVQIVYPLIYMQTHPKLS